MANDNLPPVEWNASREDPWHQPQTLRPGGGKPRGLLPIPGSAVPTMGNPLNPSGMPVSDPHHYGKIQEGNFAPGVLGAANTLAPFLTEPSTRRNLLGFRNTTALGGANIFIGFGQPGSTASWLVLTPQQIILFDEVVPQNDMYALADAAGATLSYAVSTIPA